MIYYTFFNIYIIFLLLSLSQSDILQSNFKKTRRMLAGINNGGNGGATCEAYWRFLCVSTIIMGILGMLTSLFQLMFANLVIWTVNSFQIWRLLTSFLVDNSIINVIFNLYILSMSLPLLEKMYSSAYMLLEIFIQTLICNVAFVLIGELLALLGMVTVAKLLSLGSIHLMFIFLWQRTALNPEEMTRFCCFPCVMPMKYLPWCFFGFLLLFNPDLFIIISCLVGYAQHMVLKRSLIQIPLSFYNKLESLLPGSAKQSPGFIAIRSVEANLRSVSRKLQPRAQLNQRNQGNGNPFDHNEAMNDRVQVVGKGVSIGSSYPPQIVNNAVDYRSHWVKSDEQAQQQKVDGPKEEQNKPNNLLDFNDPNETLRSDYPLNENEEDSQEIAKRNLIKK